VATLTLNTPGSLNALSDAMLDALMDAFADVAQDRTTKVLILRGSGKAFCAGHDLKEMQAGRAAPDKGRAYFEGLFARCAKVMRAIPALPQPVIAQVHGIATAAGCQLVASCDLAVAAEGTRFGVNGVNIGLFCSTPMVALSRNVPAKVAFEMLTTGQFIDAARAREVGLVNRVVPPDALQTETEALAALLAVQPRGGGHAAALARVLEGAHGGGEGGPAPGERRPGDVDAEGRADRGRRQAVRVHGAHRRVDGRRGLAERAQTQRVQKVAVAVRLRARGGGETLELGDQ
jgi:enoyl-CoA hydratase/carnithine racemase